MNDKIAALLQETKDELQGIYGDRLKDVLLYGSHARGDAGEESDADILVVLDEVAHYTAEIERTSAVTSALSLKYGISISRTFLSEQDWTARQTPFLVNVWEEAISP